MAEDLDLESYWKDIRDLPRIEVNSGKASDLEGALELASEKTLFDLQVELRKHQDMVVTTDLLAELVTLGIRTFMRHWYQGLKEQDLSGLIEIVLEGQRDMSPRDMAGFIRALPSTLLERIVQSVAGSATGIHALMAIEMARRNGKLNGYRIDKESGRIYVEFDHTSEQVQTIRFYLDESFRVIERRLNIP